MSQQAKDESLSLPSYPSHLTLREFLTNAFEEARVPYLLGPGIDGEIIYSSKLTHLSPQRAFQLAATAADYALEHQVIDGTHVVRRVSSSQEDPLKLLIQLEVQLAQQELNDLRQFPKLTAHQLTAARLQRLQRLMAHSNQKAPK